jgi:hypothetical protein
LNEFFGGCEEIAESMNSRVKVKYYRFLQLGRIEEMLYQKLFP